MKSLKAFPSVAIIGARQVGKTTLAKELVDQLKKPVHHVDLERPGSLASIVREPEEYFSVYVNHCVIIDEV
ncbi:MAG: AAA family ATPase [Bacteroidetes bacterium]|nr:AAA family ATPase [Bacteroidota bacterium]MBS1540235.1 AAA family ATPase [Bacteroidota bacterium]